MFSQFWLALAKYLDMLHARAREQDPASPELASHFLVTQEAQASRREREIEQTIALEATVEVPVSIEHCYCRRSLSNWGMKCYVCTC